MCGIITIAGRSGIQNKEAILRSMIHRGPNAVGWLELDDITLGHTRLSIIDLDATANQPMKDSTGRYTIVFNGEIYNYKELSHQIKVTLKTKSDTEVLLELFAQKGIGVLEECVGMFAFVIFDSWNQVLWAARDRFGVKPCYYHISGNQFIIASEIKTIWATGIDRVPDEETWSTYLNYGHYGNTDRTFWNAINQLPGGHWLKYDLKEKNLTVQRWYNLFNTPTHEYLLKDKEAWLEEYNALLKNAVALRFRSDVPVGVTLSGGVDSSLLFSTINEVYGAHHSLQSFTFYTNNYAYDENWWVKELLSNSNIDPTFILLQPHEVPQLAKKISNYQDEPFGGIPTIAYAKCFEAARALNIPVLLDGQGIDEAWAGYDYYRSDTPGLIQGTTNTISYNSAINKEFLELTTTPHFKTEGNSKLQHLQYRDITATKLPRALRFNDRISMMNSIELREPLLDHRLVEMAFHAPDHFKINNDTGKYLLREMVAKKAGNTIAKAPKRPVQTPQREWLANELAEWVDDQINKIDALPIRNWFNKKEMKLLWDKYKAGNMDNSFFIWQWINTVLLFEES